MTKWLDVKNLGIKKKTYSGAIFVSYPKFAFCPPMLLNNLKKTYF